MLTESVRPYWYSLRDRRQHVHVGMRRPRIVGVRGLRRAVQRGRRAQQPRVRGHRAQLPAVGRGGVSGRDPPRRVLPHLRGGHESPLQSEASGSSRFRSKGDAAAQAS